MLPPPLKRHLLSLALALTVGPVLAQTAAAPAGAGAAAASSSRTTVEQDNLWDIAGQLAPVLGATRQQVMVAVLRRNPEAFVKGNIHRLRRGVPLVLPGRDEVLAEDRAGATTLVAEHLKAMRGGQVLASLPALARVPSTTPVAPPASAPVPALPPKVDAPASVAAPPVVAKPPEPAPAPPPAPKPAPASAPVPAVEPVASVPADSASEAASAVATGGSSSVPRILPWLLVLGGLAGGVILWRRRRAGFQPDAAPPEFANSLSATRTGGPRVFDISNAAAEMARSVETSQVATQLVRSDTAMGDEVDVSRLTEQAALRLEIARASLEVGRPDDARALLQAVVREGSGRHAAEAAEILARMG
jgi:FimV-like protein